MSNIVTWIVGMLSVAETDRRVVREFWKRFKHLRGHRSRAARHKVYREALRIHHENQDLYRKVMGGNI